MSKKRRRQPARPYRSTQAARSPSGGRTPTEGARPGEANDAKKEASARRRTIDQGRSRRASGAQGRSTSARGTSARTARSASTSLRLPRFMPTFVQGLLAVGSNPLVLVSSFLGTLAIWAIYSTFHSVRILSPSELGQLLALPPMHTLLDLGIVFGGGSLRSSTVALGLAAFLLLVRAVLLGFLIALIHEVLTGEGAVNEGGYRGQFRTAAARMARSLPQLFLVEVAFLAILSFVGGLIQSLLGKLGLPVVLVVELYYLIFAPVIAVIEGRSVTDAFNLGLRVVRRSSRQSILFASGYSLLTLILLGVPAPFASASPSIQVWAYVLFMSFIHVAVLATVVLRWLAVRQEVLEGWTGPARRRSRYSLFGLFGATGERAPS